MVFEDFTEIEMPKVTEIFMSPKQLADIEAREDVHIAGRCIDKIWM